MKESSLCYKIRTEGGPPEHMEQDQMPYGSVASVTVMRSRDLRTPAS